MSKWIKLALPLGVAGVLLAAVAIGFGPPASEAGKPSAEAPAAVGCMGDEAGVTAVKGRAPDAYEFDFCSDPTLDMIVTLTWSNTNKDLALIVTAPDGTAHVSDWHVGGIEVSQHRASLQEGSWTIDVVNNDKGNVAYALSIVFV